MTRINVIDVTQLTDQHLMAEYRELPMVAGSLRRSLKSKRGIPQIPAQYTLGKNHVTFFYNKGKYLRRRYDALVAELQHREYRLDETREVDFDTFIDNDLYGDWTPNHDDLSINSNRIREKIIMKPRWYRFHSSPLDTLDSHILRDLMLPTKLWIP